MDYTCYTLDNKEENSDRHLHSTDQKERRTGEKADTEEQVNSTEKTERELWEKPETTFTEVENVTKASVFKTPLVIDSSLSRTRLLKHNVLEKWSEENQPLNLSKDRQSDAESVEKAVRSSCEVKSLSEASSQKNELPYTEPTWSGKPEVSYCFEILKNGIILSTVDLSEKSFTVFGRLGTSDYVLEHPSVSRYHAVVQYRNLEDENNPKGFYVYDLESTHGTFVNKERIQPRQYCRLHVGHVVKFGGSSRMFILQGPPEDEEKESEFTVTELKEMRRQHEEKLKRLEEKESEEDDSAEEKGIDWGMGEDAEEDLSTENPFALSTPNEDLYLDDPKKTLRGWFEREGYDLEYDVEEKGFGHFSCKIHLPIDTSTGENVYAEASVKGKKKEAVVQCALEACRILDRYGLLRQAHHESRKRKQKNWEEDDYYDSDEDTYLDRTGTIEKKRELRKRMFGKEQNVETYESLVKKLQDVEKEIETVTSKLQKSKVQAKKPEMGGNEDELDAYMSYLQSGVMDKKMQSKLQFQLNQLQQEEQRLKKLVEIARPVNLPALEKHPPNTHGEKIVTTKKAHLSHSGIMKGRLLKKPKRAPIVQPQTQAKDTIDDSIMVEEEEEEEEEEDGKGPPDSQSTASATATAKVEVKNLEKQENVVIPEESEAESKKSSSHKKQMIDIHSDEDQQNSAANGTAKAVIKGPQLPSSEELSQYEESRKTDSTCKKSKKGKEKEKEKSSYDESNPEYAMWLPPQDQSGDGKTHLNAKYGY